MSTELGEVKDHLHPTESIEVAWGTGGIRLFSTVNKIWLDEQGVKDLIKLLEIAITFRNYS